MSLATRTLRGQWMAQRLVDTGWSLPAMEAYHAEHGWSRAYPMVNTYETLPNPVSRVERLVAQCNGLTRYLRAGGDERWNAMMHAYIRTMWRAKA